MISVGVALLAAALVLSSVYSRDDGDLDWTNYLVGIAATLVLLGVAAASRLRGEAGSDLFSWPGALGIVGVGSMLGIAIDDSSVTPYVVGVVVLGLSAFGYLLGGSWTFVLSAIMGAGVVYAQVVDDIFDASDLDGDNTGMVIGVALVVFTALVTAATWFLPQRVFGGVVAGIIAVAGNFLLLTALTAFGMFQTSFVTYGGEFSDSSDPATRFEGYDNDVWVILVLSLLLVAGWAWCTWQTGQVGFRVLIVASCATVIPLATVALAVEHPSWWGAVIGILGTATLAALVLRGMRRRAPAQP